MSSAAESSPAIGFYTVEHSETLGWTGGYLLLNAGGRPLEFHCTLPVRPTRGHEILYGAALRGYLIGEAISGALLGKARTVPSLICVDQLEAMGIATSQTAPVVLLQDEPSRTVKMPSQLGTDRFTELAMHGVTFACRQQDQQRACQTIEAFDELADWNEPFSRIREAIREAQQGATARAA